MKSINHFHISKKLLIRIIGIPILSFIIALFDPKSNFQKFDTLILISYLVSLIITSTLWIGNYEIFLFMRNRFEGFTNTRKRIIYQTIANFSFTLLISILAFYSCSLFGIDSTIPFINLLIMTFVPTIIIILIYETVYTFNSWKDHVHESESLKVETIKAQLNSLRSQLDPHFLFNSLNTLASLLGETNTPAQDFLSQLSDVYRYLLINRENNEVPLKEEIDFLNAYVYLTKIRFRENINIDIKISKESYKKSIAPLSLQMLVENAIKHNAATAESPLQISVYDIEAEYIVVKNAIQEKKILTNSTGLGLLNIINRYKFLTTKEVKVYSNANQFTVEIPLLSNH